VPFNLWKVQSAVKISINDLLRPCSRFVNIYVGDPVINSSSVAEQTVHLRKILQLLPLEILYAKHKIVLLESKKLSSVDSQKVIATSTTPDTIKDVLAILELSKFYQRFLSQFVETKRRLELISMAT